MCRPVKLSECCCHDIFITIQWETLRKIVGVGHPNLGELTCMDHVYVCMLISGDGCVQRTTFTHDVMTLMIPRTILALVSLTKTKYIVSYCSHFPSGVIILSQQPCVCPSYRVDRIVLLSYFWSVCPSYFVYYFCFIYDCQETLYAYWLGWGHDLYWISRSDTQGQKTHWWILQWELCWGSDETSTRYTYPSFPTYIPVICTVYLLS